MMNWQIISSNDIMLTSFSGSFDNGLTKIRHNKSGKIHLVKIQKGYEKGVEFVDLASR